MVELMELVFHVSFMVELMELVFHVSFMVELMELLFHVSSCGFEIYADAKGLGLQGNINPRITGSFFSDQS